MRRVVDAIRALVALVEHWTLLLTDRAVELIYNLVANRVKAVLNYVVALWPSNLQFMKAQIQGVETLGRLSAKELATVFEPMFRDIAGSAFSEVAQTLTVSGHASPPDWKANAAAAMSDAYGFGFKSWATTAAFESVFPERLNVLNGTGAMLAEMSGFSEVTKAWLEPNLKSAVGRLAEYDANSRNRSVQLAEQHALNLYSRGIITAAACQQFLAYAGHPDADIASLMGGAFRPVQPFVLAASLSDGQIDEATIRGALTYAGFRPSDEDLLIAAFRQRMLQPYRQAALRSAKTAFQRGLITQNQLQSDMNTLGVPADAQSMVLIETGYVKLVELADLYRRGLDEAAQYGQEPLTSYVTDLEAIGLAPADANAHFAIISRKVQGKALQAEIRAEAAQARALLRDRTSALMAQYLDGTLPDAGAVAAILALGYSAAAAAAIYATWQARKAGRQQLVYGVLLAPKDAQLLREKVAPVLENRKKNIINDAGALATLQSLGVPLANAQALVADAAAIAAKKVKL